MKFKKFFNSKKVALTLFLLPCLLGTLVFILIPIILSFFLGFVKWDLISEIKFVGLYNYVELFTSKSFYFVLSNTFIFAFFTLIFSVTIPLVLAFILNSKIRGSEFYKTAYFLPFITPMVVIAIVWEWIFDPNIGLMNTILKTNIAWLYDTNFAMIALIIVSVWKLIGYNMVIFLSGLSALSNDVLESAKIDGASPFETFFKIVIPIISPTIFFVVIITTISSFQVFDLIYLMTQGGPENSTNVLVYWLYQNAFEYFNIGKASAIAYVLFIIIFVLTISQWKIRKLWVHNE